MDAYAMVINNTPKIASVPISVTLAGNALPNACAINEYNAANKPGKNNAMSTKIACCILNRINRLIRGLPAKKFNAKNAMKPPNGMARYNPYVSATNDAKTLSGFSMTKKRANCNPSNSGNR